MAAAALPLAVLFGVIAELVSGVVSRLLGRRGPWLGGVTGIGPDVVALVRDRRGVERASVAAAGGAAASLLGAGMAAAGGLAVGPGDLVLVYLSLGLASVGAWTVASGLSRPLAVRRSLPLSAVAEVAFAVGLGAMYLRYGTFELEAARATQQVLGTGVALGPGLAAAGLVCAAVAFAIGGGLRVAPAPDDGAGGAGIRVLARLTRWGVVGATALVAAPLLAGGAMTPFTPDSIVPVSLAALAVAVLAGAGEGVLSRLGSRWAAVAPVAALLFAAAGAAMVVLA